MNFKKTILAALLSATAAGAFAAPALQTCSPLEVTHSGGAGLSYSLACVAGEWRLQYVGAVPAGDEPVNAPYRLAATGPDGASFTLTRTVRLPAPAKLGQMLMREAVLLDSGDLALRDCKELGCTQYRPISSANSLAKASVTLTPETQRLLDERKGLQQEVTRLQQALTEAKLQHERAMEAAVADERKKTAQALAAVQTAHAEQETLLRAQTKEEMLVAERKLDGEKAGVLKKAAELEAEIARLTAAMANLTQVRDAARKDESTAKEAFVMVRQALDQAVKQSRQEKEAYDFVVADLVSQHKEQLAALRHALPDTDFKGIVGDLRIAKVSTAPVAETPVTAAPAKEQKKEKHRAKAKKAKLGAAAANAPAEPAPAAKAKDAAPQESAVLKKLAHKYERIRGQWYDMRTIPPTPIERPHRR